MSRKKKREEDLGLESELTLEEPIVRRPKVAKRSFDIVASIKSFVQKPMSRAPMTFNVGIALILFFVYGSLFIVSAPSQPILFVILVPTLYILIRYIRLERDIHKERM